MRKVMITIGTIIAVVIAISLLGPFLGLALSAAITYASIHFYLKATSTVGKVIFVILGICGILSALSNLPGFIALFAIAAIYYLYKKPNNGRKTSSKSNDPFTNFEKQWSEIQK